MNTLVLRITSLALFLLLVTPTDVSAFKFVDSSATQVSADTYLLTYTYTAGFVNVDGLFPIVAAPVTASVVDYPRVEFALSNAAKELDVSVVKAIVLSDSKIVDNQYRARKGKKSTFTLMSLVTLNSPIAEEDNLEIHLRLLPFSYTTDDQTKTGAYQVSS